MGFYEEQYQKGEYTKKQYEYLKKRFAPREPTYGTKKEGYGVPKGTGPTTKQVFTERLVAGKTSPAEYRKLTGESKIPKEAAEIGAVKRGAFEPEPSVVRAGEWIRKRETGISIPVTLPTPEAKKVREREARYEYHTRLGIGTQPIITKGPLIKGDEVGIGPTQYVSAPVEPVFIQALEREKEFQFRKEVADLQGLQRIGEDIYRKTVVALEPPITEIKPIVDVKQPEFVKIRTKEFTMLQKREATAFTGGMAEAALITIPSIIPGALFAVKHPGEAVSSMFRGVTQEPSRFFGGMVAGTLVTTGLFKGFGKIHTKIMGGSKYKVTYAKGIVEPAKKTITLGFEKGKKPFFAEYTVKGIMPKTGKEMFMLYTPDELLRIQKAPGLLLKKGVEFWKDMKFKGGIWQRTLEKPIVYVTKKTVRGKPPLIPKQIMFREIGEALQESIVRMHGTKYTGYAKITQKGRYFIPIKMPKGFKITKTVPETFRQTLKDFSLYKPKPVSAAAGARARLLGNIGKDIGKGIGKTTKQVLETKRLVNTISAKQLVPISFQRMTELFDYISPAAAGVAGVTIPALAQVPILKMEERKATKLMPTLLIGKEKKPELMPALKTGLGMKRRLLVTPRQAPILSPKMVSGIKPVQVTKIGQDLKKAWKPIQITKRADIFEPIVPGGLIIHSMPILPAFESRRRRKKKEKRKLKRKYKYTATVTAAMLNIFGKKPKRITGIEIRPLLKRRRGK